MDEFGFIDKYIKKLTNGYSGAFNLEDDIGFIKNKNLIITSDTIVENTHFRSKDDLFSVGQKLLRVNLSDIIAKGAIAKFGILNISISKDKLSELTKFFEGLEKDIKDLIPDFIILGGDTTSIIGNSVFSLTILAEPINKPILRNGAKLNDSIFISGNIGSAFLGLKSLNENLELTESEKHYLTPQIPEPIFANLIAKYANASMDISDGLIQDLSKILKLSELSANINLDEIPFNSECKNYLINNNIADLIGFGDDYQTIFTMSEDNIADCLEFAKEIGVKIEKIGEVCPKSDILINATYKDKAFNVNEIKGFTHF